MKLLVMSNVPGSVDKVVDIVERSNNVVAKETSATTSGIAHAVGEQVRNGSCEQAIVIAKDPIGVGMLLNKEDGVEAAVCSSIEDAQLAKENGANVIVIRDFMSEDLHDIVAQAVGGHGGMGKGLKLGIKMPQIMQKQHEKEEEKEEKKAEEKREEEREAKREEKKEEQRLPKEKQKAMAERKAEQAESDEDDEGTHTSNDKSLVGKIKDYLGIV